MKSVEQNRQGHIMHFGATRSGKTAMVIKLMAAMSKPFSPGHTVINGSTRVGMGERRDSGKR